VVYHHCDSAIFRWLRVLCFLYLLLHGVACFWGNNIPRRLGPGIPQFVVLVGIGHAGTLISAILYLCRQKSGEHRSIGPQKR